MVIIIANRNSFQAPIATNTTVATRPPTEHKDVIVRKVAEIRDAEDSEMARVWQE